jgi:hypothetical protein
MSMQDILKQYSPEIKGFGDILGGIGGLMQGEEVSAADSYNASILESQIPEVQFAYDINLKDIEGAEGDVLDTQRAMYAKSGVEMTGSPLDVALGTAASFEMDKLISKYNEKIAIQNIQSKAAMEKYQGKVAVNAGIFKMGSGLLSVGLGMMGSGGGGGGGGTTSEGGPAGTLTMG